MSYNIISDIQVNSMENIGLFVKKKSEENNHIKLYTLLSVNCACGLDIVEKY